MTLRLPRESAKKVLALLAAEQTTDAVVVPAKQEFTTTEAAKILGISRATLMRMLERRGIEFRMVGKHHRIRATSTRPPSSAPPSQRDQFQGLPNGRLG